MILRGSFVFGATMLSCLGLTPSVAGFGVKVSTFLPPKFATSTIKTTTFSKTALSMAGVEITMPALSSTMKEGKVVSWLKSEGDSISAGEAIMVVESDKADMDVEAFEDGILAKIIVAAGEMAPVGQAVAVMASSPEEIDQVLANYAGGAPAAAAPQAAATANGDVAASSSSSAITAPSVEYRQIDMPALSSTMKEGKVVSWLKSEGDAISAGEAIMVVESDKADMDVEAFEDGFLAAILTPEGQSGAVGQPVALVAVEASDIPALQAYAAELQGAPASAAVTAAAPAAAPAAPKAAAAAAPKASPAAVAAGSTDRAVASPLAKKKAEELGVDLSKVVGSGPEGRITAADVELAAQKGGAAPAKAAAASSSAQAKPVWVPAPGVIAATPTARALAKKAKLDLSKIKGTGEFGRVTADDVRIATGEKQPEKPAPAKKTSSAAASVELPDGFVPFTGMQRGVSKNMVATLTTPIFRVSRDIEMDKFDALYQTLKPKGVTVSAMLAKAVALAIEKYPIINSAYSDKDGGGILFKKDINIAMAVAIDGGLITPTLKYANERSLVELGENWKELVGKAKAGKLTPDEYQSGTFAISNLGMFGIPQFDAILPPGMGGILAVGSTQELIVPDSAALLGLKKVKKMTVTLTCDHRQIYGADGALFLQELANVMENKLDRIAA